MMRRASKALGFAAPCGKPEMIAQGGEKEIQKSLGLCFKTLADNRLGEKT